MIEQRLTTLLSAICPQTHPLRVPTGVAPPFVVYQRVSTSRLRDLQGSAGVAWATFRVDAYATSYLAARRAANAIRVALESYSDGEVMAIVCEQERDLSELVEDERLSRVQLEFVVQHRE